jgi:putative ABC transport system permease protein
MRDILYMTWCNLAFHKVRSIILVISITLTIYLPIGLKVVVDQSADSLTTRAEATPLIVGAKGSPLELALNSLYFESGVSETIPCSESARVDDTGLAMAIPLYTRFKSGKQPIVGTSIDYFDFRGLKIAEGHNFTMLGDCVLGAKAAEKLKATTGDHVISSPESVFDIAGVYPLKMRVTGVLAATESPDDEAIFVDLKTAWIIEGRAHGHEDLSKPEAASGILRKEGDVIVGNASVVQYREINPENLDSFHFHGSPDDFPITSVIAVPRDQRAAALLRGKYLGDEERVQIIEPASIMGELLSTILTVRSYFITAIILVGISTFALAILVFLLSLRLRLREIATMHKIGGARGRVFSIVSAEMLVIILLGSGLAVVLTMVTGRYGADMIRHMLL